MHRNKTIVMLCLRAGHNGNPSDVRLRGDYLLSLSTISLFKHYDVGKQKEETSTTQTKETQKETNYRNSIPDKTNSSAKRVAQDAPNGSSNQSLG